MRPRIKEKLPDRLLIDLIEHFIDPRTGGALAHVANLTKKEKRIIISLRAKGHTVLFLPLPMVNLCLFHIDQDLRKR